MKKIDVCNTSIEPDKNVLWLNNGHLKYYGTNGWENIQSETKYANVSSTLGDIEVEVELPIATDIQLGGVRIMHKDDSHLIVSKEGNLYVYTTDNYYMPEGTTDSPDMIPTLAALHSLYQDVVLENQYANTTKAGIVKQAENVSGTSKPGTMDALNTKLNNLIIKLQEAGIMVKDK